MAEMLVLGGVHGDEVFGSALVRSLQESPITNVDAEIANPRAAEEGRRFIDNELSLHSDPNGKSYEDRRFAELVEKGRGYRLILDFHNSLLPGTVREAWLYPPLEPLKRPIQWFIAHAAIRHVVRFGPNWKLYEALPQTVLIEQSLPQQNYDIWEDQQIKRWRHVIQEMARTGLNNLPPSRPDITMTVEHVTDITRETAKQTNLAAFPHLERYDSVSPEIAAALGLTPANYRAFYWGYKNMSELIPNTNGEREYWGSVVREIEPFI